MVTLAFVRRRPIRSRFYLCWRRRLVNGRRLTWIQLGPFEFRAW